MLRARPRRSSLQGMPSLPQPERISLPVIVRRTFLGGAIALEGGRWFDGDQPTWICRECGKDCDIAPEPPERAICEACCPDHEYEYDRMDRHWTCKHCGALRPYDWDDGL
jgi:hypothetical protein